jgi:hypothetical protein
MRKANNKFSERFQLALLGLIAALLICPKASWAQWIKSYGGTGRQIGHTLAIASDDGYILAGEMRDNETGGVDALILKISASGELAWQKAYGNTGDNIAKSIARTNDGGYVVTLTNSQKNLVSAVILKISNTGEKQWVRNYYGGAYYNILNAITQTSDMGYIATGTTNSNDAHHFRGFWVLKVSNTGEVEWSNTYEGRDEDQAYSIQQTIDGGYIVAGTTKSGAGGDDVWVLKLESDGAIQWQNTYGGVMDERAYSIKQTSEGGYVLAGYEESFIGGNGNIWILKLSAEGNVLWEKTYDGGGWDYARFILQTTDGGYIVAGYTNSELLPKRDAMVMRLDGNGDPLWAKAYGGDQIDDIKSIKLTTAGDLVAVGYTSSYSKDGYDVWVLKTDRTGNVSGCPVPENIVVSVANSEAIVSGSEVSPEPFSPAANTTDLVEIDPGFAEKEVCVSSAAPPIPIGVILDWWRPDASWQVPEGYAICDGSRIDDPYSPLNGYTLPDLTGKFIRGVTDVTTIGAPGGSEKHQHSSFSSSMAGSHDHSVDVAKHSEISDTELIEAHKHQWLDAEWNGKGLTYRTWKFDDSKMLIRRWGDGTEIRGKGSFPLTPKVFDQFQHDWYTKPKGAHSHDYSLEHDHPPTETSEAEQHEHYVSVPEGEHLPPYIGLLKIMRIR